MLSEFRVENFRSLRDEQVLSMEATSGPTADDPRPRIVPGHDKPLLPVAALYGANASGKSNVLAAFQFMREAVRYSADHDPDDPFNKRWSSRQNISREAFAWGKSFSLPSTFEITVSVSEKKLRYGFVTTDERFEEEWLYEISDESERICYTREGGAFHFGDNEILAEVSRKIGDKNLLLSAMQGTTQPVIAALHEWFRWGHFCDLLSNSRLRPTDHGEMLLAAFASPRPYSSLDSKMRPLFFSADLGIVDFRIRDNAGRRSIEIQHAAGDRWLPIERQSTGTQTMLYLAASASFALHMGLLLAVDELESSLHPALASTLIDLFNDPEKNPYNAQLLFTTHDTNLLGNTSRVPALRRDEIWFTEKDRDGATKLYPLTDFHAREPENLERGYLQGRYGAVPFLGAFPLSGAEHE